MTTEPKRVRKVKAPPDPINNTPPDTPPDLPKVKTQIHLQEYCKDTIRTLKGRKPTRPTSRFIITDTIEGAGVQTFEVWLDAPATIAVEIMKRLGDACQLVTVKDALRASTKDGVSL